MFASLKGNFQSFALFLCKLRRHSDSLVLFDPSVTRCLWALSEEGLVLAHNLSRDFCLSHASYWAEE